MPSRHQRRVETILAVQSPPVSPRRRSIAAIPDQCGDQKCQQQRQPGCNEISRVHAIFPWFIREACRLGRAWMAVRRQFLPGRSFQMRSSSVRCARQAAWRRFLVRTLRMRKTVPVRRMTIATATIPMERFSLANADKAAKLDLPVRRRERIASQHQIAYGSVGWSGLIP